MCLLSSLKEYRCRFAFFSFFRKAVVVLSFEKVMSSSDSSFFVSLKDVVVLSFEKMSSFFLSLEKISSYFFRPKRYVVFLSFFRKRYRCLFFVPVFYLFLSFLLSSIPMLLPTRCCLFGNRKASASSLCRRAFLYHLPRGIASSTSSAHALVRVFIRESMCSKLAAKTASDI